MHVSTGAPIPKPARIFDRDAEWNGLVSFATDARPGATLGVVSDRRRQGKSYLIRYLFRLTGDRAVPVVIDEFPYLVKASPALASIIQRELGPGGSGSASQARLLLCGSAMGAPAARP